MLDSFLTVARTLTFPLTKRNQQTIAQRHLWGYQASTPQVPTMQKIQRDSIHMASWLLGRLQPSSARTRDEVTGAALLDTTEAVSG